MDFIVPQIQSIYEKYKSNENINDYIDLMFSYIHMLELKVNGYENYICKNKIREILQRDYRYSNDLIQAIKKLVENK